MATFHLSNPPSHGIYSAFKVKVEMKYKVSYIRNKMGEKLIIPIPPQSNFKVCPSCGYQWNTREQFLADPDLAIIGYQADFRVLELGLLLFNHRCKSTLALKAIMFRDLYEGPIYRERRTGTDSCPAYCLRENQLVPCPASCECSYVREIIHRINFWPKNAVEDPKMMKSAL